MLTKHLGDRQARTRSPVGVAGRGFTLVELIMVMVILGVLAAVAAPRMFSSSDFYARGFHDETLALLRYAQKTAIAQRRVVCVTFDAVSTPNTVSLMMENPAPIVGASPVAVNCATNVVSPKGEAPAQIQAGTGVTFNGAKMGNTDTTAPTNFNFDALGQPIDSTVNRAPVVTQTIHITNASDVFVEAVTGYVHD